MNPVLILSIFHFIFNVFLADGAFSWLLKFADFDELDRFQEALMQSLWETNNKMVWSKVKPDDREFLADAFSNIAIKDVEMEDADDKFFDVEEEEEEPASKIKRA